MPTVYYTDGTPKKYKYSEILHKDPYLEKNFYECVNEDIHPYQLALAGFGDLNFIMKNMLPVINIRLLEEKIIKTKTININGLWNMSNIKYGWCEMVYPLIDEDIIRIIITEYIFVKKLYLSNNLIENEPFILLRFFKDLEKIKLSKNLLTEIPNSIFKLSKLKKLVIIGLSKDFPKNENKVNNISIIPKEIKNLQSLLHLNLENQRLTLLPPEFKELTNLKKLYLSDNNFTTLPIEICSLKNLKILEMNRMDMNIPCEIIKLKNLEILKLQGGWYVTDKHDSQICGVYFEKLPTDIFVKTKLKEIEIDNFTELSYESLKIKRNLTINSNSGTQTIKILYDKNTKIINYTKYHSFFCRDGTRGETPINQKQYKLIDDDLYIYNEDMEKFVKIEPY
jgi:hypothetical protein